MKRLISLILALVLIFSFSISSFAADDVFSSDLKSGWSVSGTTVSNPTGYTSSWFTNVLKFLSLLGRSSDNSGTSSIYGRLWGIESNTKVLGSTADNRNSISIMGKLLTLIYDFNTFTTTDGLYQTVIKGRLDTNLSTLNTHLNGIDNSADNIETDVQTVVDKLGNSFTSGSVLYYLSNILTTDNNILTQTTGIHSDTTAILPLVRRIRDMVGDDDDYRRKQESENNNQSFENNFLTGDNSVSTSDIGALSGLGTSFKDFFSMTGAGGGSAEVDISAWSDILAYDEPFTFFTEADTIAESMGVSAGGAISNPGQSYVDLTVHYYLEGTTNSVKDDDIIFGLVSGTDYTVTAPDITGYVLVGSSSQTLTLDTSDNVVIFYYNAIQRTLTYFGYNRYTVTVNGSSAPSGYVLNNGDVISVTFDYAGTSQGVYVNDVYYASDDSSVVVRDSDISLIVYSQPSIFGEVRTITITYYSSPALMASPRRSLASVSVDYSNEVVTHYYADNLNKLFGLLRGD